MFEGICDAIHRELEELDKKFAGGARMSAPELETIDRMAHALKCMKTYEAMSGSAEYGYRRPRYYERDEYRRY